MVYTPSAARRGAMLVGAVAVLGVLTACGGASDRHSDPMVTAPGTAAPATGTTKSPASATSAAGASTPAGRPSAPALSSGPRTSAPSGGGTTAATDTRCHTSQLRASVGRNDPGAGQENFPVVVTNASARSCTVRGYPGAAFVDASGTQLGADPKRESGSPVTVTLDPGQSAWAGLTFSNPGISGAKTATPATLLITPPDEKDQLKVVWSGGAVPVSGNSSTVFLSVFSPGTGP
ncbi:DUF4232 domain-containing protein [Streptomyces sp. NK08204]|uniref:DUF4232 domain-containing protein n=1 Tax=Streptomyces sp. NK08204 TaxID=2873260 RepID=UPI001CEC6377|nr:DUF4232 domain-containing protein [Streptomyces sp. NK08204]